MRWLFSCVFLLVTQTVVVVGQKNAASHLWLPRARTFVAISRW